MLLSNSQIPRKLPVELVLLSISDVVKALGLDKEPMYGLNEENIAKLKYLCEITETSFLGEQKYKTVEEKAAILFCRATKNHMFPNGNKRTAVILTLLFLRYNDCWVVMSGDDLYSLSLAVAESSQSEESEIYEKVLTKIKETIIKDV